MGSTPEKLKPELIFAKRDTPEFDVFDNFEISSLDLEALENEIFDLQELKRNGLVMEYNEHYFSNPIARNRFSSQLEPLDDLIRPRVNYHLRPNVSDKTTILSAAIMANDAYAPHEKDNDWYDLNNWNRNISFGWTENAMRGHVFVSNDQTLAVIAYKGTSPSFFGYGSPTGENDKLNDNSMFSCCCGKGAIWNPVCDCSSTKFSLFNMQSKCSISCVKKQLHLENSYFNAARKIYKQVRLQYPNIEIWFTGHSLGGALASLVGLSTGHPVIAFQTPGDHLVATRYGFEMDPKDLILDRKRHRYAYTFPIFHFGVSIDPIFTGQCTGMFSACYFTGYAIESQCHIGSRCTYQYGSLPDIRFHRITLMIQKMIMPSTSVPDCEPVWYGIPGKSSVDTCKDCVSWEFAD